MNLINGDCLIELKKLKEKSIDFVYLDLPFGQTACAWDKKLDLTELWIQLRRIAKNDRTPFFFSCTTKFGFELFNNAPKGYFRWDLCWEKNRAAGFLNAYRLPMRKHEMIYCFAKKTPEYDVSSHSEFKTSPLTRTDTQIYGVEDNFVKGKRHTERLPTSVLPPQEDHELIYCFAKKSPEYDVSSHSEYKTSALYKIDGELYGKKDNYVQGKTHKERLPTSVIPPQEDHELIYCFAKKSPQDIPSSWCKIKNDEGINHRTAKPVKLMEFLLKYWSKEGDTILDPTAGSGSMGVACLNMKRNFIGIEKDCDIFAIMKDRLDKHNLHLKYN